LGAAWYLPEERQITTTEQMFDEMTAALGGRASERVMFGKISTGALNDLEKVTKQAFNMIAYFGLNDKIGNISYYDSSGQQEYNLHKPYSEKTAELIDEEVKILVEKAYVKAVKILKENKSKLEELAYRLLDKEVIFSEDLVEIFGIRPWDAEKRIEEENHRKEKALKTKKAEEELEAMRVKKTDKADKDDKAEEDDKSENTNSEK